MNTQTPTPRPADAAERQRLYRLYTHLKERYAAAQTAWQQLDRDRGVVSFGPWDDEEETRRHEAQVQQMTLYRTQMDDCTAIWNFILTQYTNWDVQLAVQEAEGRIGELPMLAS